MPYAPQKWVEDKGAANSRLEKLRGPRHSPTGVVGLSSMLSARHLFCLVCVSRISSPQDTFESDKGMRNTHFKPKASYGQMMSLIAAWRQGKDREEVPLANIDSWFVSFGEHAAVRAPLSRLNLLKRSSGHPRDLQSRFLLHRISQLRMNLVNSLHTCRYL